MRALALRSLGVTGARAIESLFDGGPLPGLAQLDLAFASPDDAQRELVVSTGLVPSRFPDRVAMLPPGARSIIRCGL